MTSFLYRWAISLVLELIDTSIKNPKSRVKWKDTLCQIGDQIDILYPERRFENGFKK